MTGEAIQHSCPSCGRPTSLTAHGPEPSLCLDCQRAFGLASAESESKLDVGAQPDDPVWGSLAALGVWFASILALAAGQAGAVLYLAYAGRTGMAIPPLTEHLTNPTIGFVHILSSGVAHAVTLLLAYVVVTDGGRLPFFASLGWRWPDRLRLRHVFTAALALQIFTILMVWLVPTPESTTFSRLLNSSPWTKLAVGVFAILTAPLVEEVVYRGILYPALARRFGRPMSIVVVAALFLAVHADQYDGALAIMVPLGTLSVVLTMLRAYTGSLLPSIALHVFFNAITVAFMFAPGGEAT